MTDKQRKICEGLGWEVYETEDDIELRKFSPLGEDFGFSVDADKFIEGVRKYWQDFEPDEHAAMWFNAKDRVPGVPRDLQALLNDANAIDEMIDDLAGELEFADEDYLPDLELKEAMEGNWKIVLVSSGVKQDFMSGFASEQEAEEFAEKHGWVWLDENQFEWRMEIEED